MKQPIRCPTGTLYDATVHAECPCASCWADRSSAILAAKTAQTPIKRFIQTDQSDAFVSKSIPPDPKAIKTEQKADTGRPRTLRTPKVYIGITAIVAIALGGYYGATLWLKSRVQQEVDSAFSSVRSALGKATYGRIEFDHWTRSIMINDIFLQSDRLSIPTTKIGQLTLTRAAMRSSEQVSVQRVDIKALELTFSMGGIARIESLSSDDLNVEMLAPSEFLALVEASAQFAKSTIPPDIFLSRLASLSERMRIGTLEMRGVTINESPRIIRYGVVRFNKLENGRLAEFASEDFKLTAPQQSANVHRLALRGINVAGLLRKSARFSLVGQAPTPTEAIEFLPLLEAIEMKGFTEPNARAGQFIHIESFRASWGQFIGTVPSSVRVSANMTGPISMADQYPFKALAEAGHKSLTFAFDVAGAWTESTKTFVFTPIVVEVRNMFTASAKLTIANVLPNIFVTDPALFTLAARALEASPIEFSLRDSGGVDLWIAQMAKAQSVSLETARKTQIDNLYKTSQTQSRTNPDFQRLVNVVGRFIETPGATLRINLAPKGKVVLMEALELVKANPAGVLSRFTFEATVNR